MDNLGSHKGQAVRKLIRSVGAKLFFLPRYSPDLNPIEQVFAKLKTLLRKTDPRTTEATWRGIGTLLDRFKPEECANSSSTPVMLQFNRIVLLVEIVRAAGDAGISGVCIPPRRARPAPRPDRPSGF